MVETYRSNPNFGDTKQFLRELDVVTNKMQKLEAEAQAGVQTGRDCVQQTALQRQGGTLNPQTPHAQMAATQQQVPRDTGTEGSGGGGRVAKA